MTTYAKSSRKSPWHITDNGYTLCHWRTNQFWTLTETDTRPEGVCTMCQMVEKRNEREAIKRQEQEARNQVWLARREEIIRQQKEARKAPVRAELEKLARFDPCLAARKLAELEAQ